MNSKVIRLNEIQIMVLKQFLSDCSYYVKKDMYAFVDKERKMKNDTVLYILNGINQKLDVRK